VFGGITVQSQDIFFPGTSAGKAADFGFKKTLAFCQAIHLVVTSPQCNIITLWLFNIAMENGP
jgi:hypothetical protein